MLKRLLTLFVGIALAGFGILGGWLCGPGPLKMILGSQYSVAEALAVRCYVGFILGILVAIWAAMVICAFAAWIFWIITGKMPFEDKDKYSGFY